MTVRVSIPPLLRTLTGGRRELEAEGGTIFEVLTGLTGRNPALALHLFDEAGAVRRHIICIHDSALVRAGDMRSRAVRADDEIVITNALAGG